MQTKRIPRSIPAFAVITLAAATLAVSPLFAQNQTEDENRNDPVHVMKDARESVKITEKFAKVVELPFKIRRVDGFDPTVIAVTALAPNRIRVQAIDTGVTTLIMEDENEKVWSLEVFVTGDVRHLQAYINRLFPHASVEAVEVRESVVLRGWVTQPEHITEMIEVAEEFYPRTLNQIKVGGVQQVQLNVKVMEVQRSKLRQLGMNFLFIGNNGYFASTPGGLTPITGITPAGGGATSIQLAGNSLADSTLSLGLLSGNSLFQGFVEAMRQEGLLKIMAEPSITTTNGRPATLLNGGEFPILVPAGLGTVGIEFKEFGIRMEAVPIILGGGRLRLELQPEVSERDFANSVTVQGVTVPGLTVRRANTQVEMRFGETLMIAGLIASRNTASTSKVPFFGELPWIGSLFSRKRYEEVETELVILVTPQFVAPLDSCRVPPGGPGRFTDVPVDRELFWHQMIEVPKYGDECETCPIPVQGLIYPSNVPGQPTMAPPGGGTVPPAPALETVPPAPGFTPAPSTETSRLQRSLLTPQQSSQSKVQQTANWTDSATSSNPKVDAWMTSERAKSPRVTGQTAGSFQPGS